MRRHVIRSPQCATIHSHGASGRRQIHNSRVKLGASLSFREAGNMREALLVNPFNSKQGPAQLVSRRASPSTPVCSTCQSDDVVSHAVAQWSNESQEWQLASTFNQPAHCNGCNGPWLSPKCHPDRIEACSMLGKPRRVPERDSNPLPYDRRNGSNAKFSPANRQKSNHLAQNGLAFLCKPSIAVRTGSR
jgi:hypothetical protein